MKRQRQFQLERAHGLHSPSANNATSSNPSVSPNAVVDNATRLPSTAGGDVAGRVRQQDRAAGEDAAANNPSVEASQDPAATRHAPVVEGQEKSKYEASGVFRSRKGDRFS